MNPGPFSSAVAPTPTEADILRPTSALPTNAAVLQTMVQELSRTVDRQERQLAEMQQTITELVRRLRRMPRERPAEGPDLFAALTAESDPLTSAPTPSADGPVVDSPRSPIMDSPLSSSPPARKTGHGRRSLEQLLEKLPRERREHTLDESELPCPCCGRPRHKIGEQVTHQLEYVPARLVCIEHAQFTYSCPHCPEHIETTPKPPQPIDRGLPGPGLLAIVTAHKFDDYLPLYRQELDLSRAGLFLARSTLCDWLMSVGDLVQPLVERMHQQLFQSKVVQTDGTSIQVLVPGQRQTQTGYFWPCLGDKEHPYVVIDFSLNKRKEHPQAFLSGYRGYVQVDAYSAYDGCFLSDATQPKIEVGCWSHVERYFEAAQGSDPRRSAEGLAFIRALFAIERRAKQEHRDEHGVWQLRQQESVPILAEMGEWLERTRNVVLPKSPLADALRYTANQWTALNRFLEAGYLSLENNAAERVNKWIARGRLNWLFVGSQRGGVTASRLLSLVTTCRQLRMDSFAYLQDVFKRLPQISRSDQVKRDELLPDRWLKEHPEAGYPPEREGHGHGDARPRRPHRIRQR
jgi:transposase